MVGSCHNLGEYAQYNCILVLRSTCTLHIFSYLEANGTLSTPLNAGDRCEQLPCRRLVHTSHSATDDIVGAGAADRRKIVNIIGEVKDSHSAALVYDHAQEMRSGKVRCYSLIEYPVVAMMDCVNFALHSRCAIIEYR